MSRREEIDDLIGFAPEKRKPGRPRKDPSAGPPKPKRKPGRPRKVPSDASGQPHEADDVEIDLSSAKVYELLGGVSVQWLAKAFTMTRHNVEIRLRNLRPIDIGKHGNPLYSLPEAASYLVTPKFDMNEYLRSVKPEDMPEHLRNPYWQAKIRQQTWQRNAGQLWPTEAVLERFSEVLLNIKTKIQQIPDTVERTCGLNIAQYKVVSAATDGILDEIHSELLKMASEKRTPSQLVAEEVQEEDA